LLWNRYSSIVVEVLPELSWCRGKGLKSAVANYIISAQDDKVALRSY